MFIILDIYKLKGRKAGQFNTQFLFSNILFVIAFNYRQLFKKNFVIKKYTHLTLRCRTFALISLMKHRNKSYNSFPNVFPSLNGILVIYEEQLRAVFKVKGTPHPF